MMVRFSYGMVLSMRASSQARSMTLSLATTSETMPQSSICWAVHWRVVIM